MQRRPYNPVWLLHFKLRHYPAQTAYRESVFRRMTETGEWKQSIQTRGWIDRFASAEGCRSGLKFYYEQMRLGLSELGLDSRSLAS